MPHANDSGLLPATGSRARLWALAFFCLAPLAFGLFSLALGQDANWDLRNYHFYNAYAFLNDRYAQDLLPSQTPYFYNPLMDVPFFLMATHLPAWVCGFALGAFQGLNCLLLFCIAHATLVIHNERNKVLICAALAIVGMLGGGGIALIGTTFGDNVTSLGIFMSAALVLRHWKLLTDGKNSAKSLLAAVGCGLPAGMMIGLKLPCVVYAVGLCFGLLLSGKGKRGFLPSIAFGIGIMLGCTITLWHWAAFLDSNFGSPLFPYFNNIFHSPLQPPVSARDIQFVPNNLKDFLLMPFVFTQNPYRVGEIPWKDLRIPLLYIVLPLAAALRMLFGRNRNAQDVMSSHYKSRYLLVTFAVSYFVWLIMFSIYRYAVPIEMMAPLLLLLAIDMLPIKISTRGLSVAFALALVVSSLQPGDWHRRPVWLERFVEVKAPPLGDASNLMILMAGTEPYSHVIPEFPPEASFVRIQSNFSSPEQDKGINKLLHDRVNAHRAKQGRFMLLVPHWQIKSGGDAAAFFELKPDQKKCLDVTDRLFDDAHLSLCPLVPI